MTVSKHIETLRQAYRVTTTLPFAPNRGSTHVSPTFFDLLQDLSRLCRMGYRRELGACLLFDALSILYDAYGSEWNACRELMMRNTPRTILEVGSGTGRLLSRVVSSFPDSRVIGLEPDFLRSIVARAKVLYGTNCQIITRSVIDPRSLHLLSSDLVLLPWVLFAMTARERELLFKSLAQHCPKAILILEPGMQSDYTLLRSRFNPKGVEMLRDNLQHTEELIEKHLGGFNVVQRPGVAHYVFPDYHSAHLLLANVLSYWHGVELTQEDLGVLRDELFKGGGTPPLLLQESFVLTHLTS